MKNRQNKHRKILIFSCSLVLLLSGVTLVFSRRNASGISWICQLSDECRQAAEEEERANEQSNASQEAASALEVKVQELSTEIAAQETRINVTRNEIKKLQAQITETEAKLKEKQEGLAELLVKTHFENDTEPIKILAGASSISDLAEKASRVEVAKQQISLAAENVRETKLKLEEEKQSVENLLAEQKEAQANLVAKRAEQQDLVQKYQDDAEAYAEVAKAARAAQQKAMEDFQAAHPDLFQGQSAYAGAFNSYPWQDRCPEQQDVYAFAPRYYYLCECTDYAAWKVYEYYGQQWVTWGNASNWANTARANGKLVDHIPAPHTVGQSVDGPYGHVFWVESVNPDGSVNATEYNNAYASQLYLGDFHYGDFGSRVISASEASSYNYIHP